MPKKTTLRTPDPQPLLRWYDSAARTLPWRMAPGSKLPVDPYRVWLSEIMLQQTTVAAVIAYFNRFTHDYPSVAELAAAPLDDILTRWAGLGYYARARNLHKCAQAIVADHGGQFPQSEAALLALPGIGPYTAAAIASIAFDQRAIVVDGNVERVISRLFRVQTPLPQSRPDIRTLTDRLTPAMRCGDFAQAMMDLGATICTPTSPQCGICPWHDVCEARSAGDVLSYPRKAAKTVRPTRFGLAFWLEADGHVWLRRRPPKGLLGGMTEMPSSQWSSDYDFATALRAAPVPAKWQRIEGRAVHIFTHFKLELDVVRATLPAKINLEQGFWQPLSTVAAAGLPTALRKVAELILSTQEPKNGAKYNEVDSL
jgi:A/G-specific adenine glycosylase